jgi:alkylhydroperoxidase family enzyme
VRDVFDDIRATRQTNEINNFWKAIANHPPTLQRTWATLKEVMGGPGEERTRELDPLVRELIYLAVSVTKPSQIRE